MIIFCDPVLRNFGPNPICSRAKAPDFPKIIWWDKKTPICSWKSCKCSNKSPGCAWTYPGDRITPSPPGFFAVGFIFGQKSHEKVVRYILFYGNLFFPTLRAGLYFLKNCFQNRYVFEHFLYRFRLRAQGFCDPPPNPRFAQRFLFFYKISKLFVSKI